MQAAACLVGGVVKLAARVKRCEYHPLCGYALRMHSHGDSAPVILHRTGAVRLQHHMDMTAVSCEMLVHRIIYDLIY